MKQSLIFLRTSKTYPKDEVAINAKLLIRGNFIDKLMAGVYSFLPLGFKVRSKIIKIIEEEMDKLGAVEMIMPALHPKFIWESTGRWEEMSPIMYQFKDHSGKDVGLGPTHEEIITTIAKGIISSYLDLPKAVYQIQTKFRDEKRAKSGILRGREFTMKDLYSFHTDEKSLEIFYEEVKKAYLKIFKRCGLVSYVTEASGGSFSENFSHEFMVETKAGEDEIFLCRKCGFARNKEIAHFKEGDKCPNCKSNLEKTKTVEVGNIFKLGTKYSEAVGLNFRDKSGNYKPVVMGCYGIGVERLMGTIVEIYNDQNGILWPESVAPFLVHLLTLDVDNSKVFNFSKRVYNTLRENGVDVLWDEREKVTPGEKFFDADLIGCPYRLVVSEKLIAKNKIEIKKRNSKNIKVMSLKESIKLLKK